MVGHIINSSCGGGGGGGRAVVAEDEFDDCDEFDKCCSSSGSDCDDDGGGKSSSDCFSRGNNIGEPVCVVDPPSRRGCCGGSKVLYELSGAPEYLRFNPYITGGYRGALDAMGCVKSILWWTNESVNIWSHLGGFLFFLGVAVWGGTGGGKDGSEESDWVFEFVAHTLVLTCFQACMLLSSLYHTFCCMSEVAYRGWLTVDLFGVSLALFAIYVSGITFAFQCTNQGWWMFYVTSVVLIFTLTVVVQILPPLVHCGREALKMDPDNKRDSGVGSLFRWRLVLFTGWAGYGVVPMVHFVMLRGWGDPFVGFLVGRVLGMYAISVVAFVFYISKFPERYLNSRNNQSLKWEEGRSTTRRWMNFLGTSHQLWHALIFLALVYWVTVVCNGVRAFRSSSSSSGGVGVGGGVCHINEKVFAQ